MNHNSHLSHSGLRYQYVIGDVQGCFTELKALLKHIEFDPSVDQVFFAGDLVARGPDSLGVLRFVKKLCERGVAATVLGNHDLNLLACARGLRKIKDKDLIRDVIDAIDSDDLIDWLRMQPLALEVNGNTLISHAGIPCIWNASEALQYAQEVAQVLLGDWETLDAFLTQMYGSEPRTWDHTLQGHARLRCITNYLTRMRLTTAEGEMEFDFKQGLDDPMPHGFAPWFHFDSRAAATHQLIFGHWAALAGYKPQLNMQNVDGGCVWGQSLMAYRLQDQQLFAVSADQSAVG